ncbi:MAG: glycosyltransferase [Bacteroidetes bacterium]|nr:glycosyltransferase [Bacteroidota bacterium]
MKKVLLVLGNNRVYGTEKYVIDIASGISKNEFEVTVAIPEEGPISTVLSNLQIPQYVYNNGKMDFFSLKGTSNLLKYIYISGFDIIHANNGIIPCVIGLLLGVKMKIENKHGLYLEDEIKNYSFSKVFKEKIKQYFTNITLVTSTHDKNIVTKYFNYNSGKIRIVSNRIDFQKLKLSKNRFNNFEKNSEINICSVGRLTYQKNQEVMIRSMSHVVKKYKNAKLSIVGTGEDKEELLKLINELNLNNSVKILPYTDKIPEFLDSNDIFILTSRFEGVTYAVQEAMGMGIPVISTYVGGLQDLLINRKNSLVVPSGNYTETSEAIIELIENKDLYNSISSNGISCIKENSLDKMISEITSVYNNF